MKKELEQIAENMKELGLAALAHVTAYGRQMVGYSICVAGSTRHGDFGESAYCTRASAAFV